MISVLSMVSDLGPGMQLDVGPSTGPCSATAYHSSQLAWRFSFQGSLHIHSYWIGGSSVVRGVILVGYNNVK